MAFLDQTLTAPPETYSYASPFAEERVIFRTRKFAPVFQKGLFAYHRGDYSSALHEFEKAAAIAYDAEDYNAYIECCSYVLRILAEREDYTKISEIEKSVLSVLSNEKGADLAPSLKSRVLYVLGICSCYEGREGTSLESKYDLATARFREAVDYAVLSGDKKALASPLYGVATVLYARRRYEEALRELDRLGVLTSCLPLPDINTAANLLKAMILRNQGHYDEALDSAWKAFDSLKHHPHLVLYLHTLCVIGEIFIAKGDLASARLYLDLAQRSLKREDVPRVARLLDKAMAALGAQKQPPADLIYDTRTSVLVEKYKGEIRFEGQFILTDLLKTFLEQPGRIYSKKELAEKIWHEPYDSQVHDNKIYVTIKRLRQLIETEGKTKYILRAKAGYYLNTKIKVLINDQPILPAGEATGTTER